MANSAEANAGDTIASNAVAARYRNSSYCYILLVGDPQRADNLPPEAFIRVHRRLGDLKDPAALKAWLIAALQLLRRLLPNARGTDNPRRRLPRSLDTKTQLVRTSNQFPLVEAHMTKNMGILDRTLRAAAAVVIGALYFSHQITGALALVLGIFAVVFVVTSVVGFCPLYVPFGLSTRKTQPAKLGA